MKINCSKSLIRLIYSIVHTYVVVAESHYSEIRYSKNPVNPKSIFGEIKKFMEKENVLFNKNLTNFFRLINKQLRILSLIHI